MTIERGDDMRRMMLIYLALLCLMLAGAGWMAQQAQVIAEEQARLQQEILTLEQENALLRERIAE
jgi:Na+-transporting NADH:ubiquinone oxidoreductase subunit NqrB